MIVQRFFLLIAVISLLPAAACASPTNTSGLPLPRFVTLKPEEANIRTGPGTRYPIQWVYRRQGMPVEVIEEYDLWRKIRDPEGTTGWVHKTMLDGKRSVMIRGKEAHVIRIDPEPDARPLLKAEPTVIGRLLECQSDWCRVKIDNRKGWIEKKFLWGVYKDEVFE